MIEKEMNDENGIMTVKEVAAYLKISEITAYKNAKNGKIPGFRIGYLWRFRKSDIDKLKQGKGK